VGFAHRHLTRDSAARRYLTSAIFPVYILHQTVIVVVAHALKPSHLYPPIEGVLLVLVTAATCFLSYELIRRVRLLRPLFGLERDAAAPRKLEPGGSVAARRLEPELAVPQDIN
jgi:glucan biosynthesis protein C